jgi:hydroxymethylglutaryl-CoA lyase
MDPLPTETKIALIEALLDAGFRRMEIGSFVSPRAVPQMADMAVIAEHFRDRQGVRLAALVPNRKGAELALAHHIRELVFVFSASESHNLKNVRQTVAESLRELEEIQGALRGAAGTRLRVDLATSFDCPYDGEVPALKVLDAVAQIRRIAEEVEIALCDTTGRANPHQVHRTFVAVMSEFGGPDNWAFHGHDTFGLGVANGLYAYQAGVRTFDTSAAGLGGCPFAPGATGNTASEDLVFAFEQSGIATGIRLEALLSAADRIAALPGASLGGHLRTVPRSRALQTTASSST